MITIEPPGNASDEVLAISKLALTRYCNRARALVGMRGEIDVLLTTDRELQRLNRTFRGKNKPTDVLSFPTDPVPGLPPDQLHAGDLAISLETAARQAVEHGHALAVELRVLLLHGLLHLAGMDHETDRGEMGTRETELRARLRLPSGLIARAGSRPAAARADRGEAPLRPESARRTRARGAA